MIMENIYNDVEWQGAYFCCCREPVTTSRVPSNIPVNDLLCAKSKEWTLDDMAPSIL